MTEIIFAFEMAARGLTASLFCGVAIVGLWFAANHTFTQNGELKGLILYRLNQRLSHVFYLMDKPVRLVKNGAPVSIPQAVKNLMLLLFVGYVLTTQLWLGAVKGDSMYLSVLWVSLALLFWGKSFTDIGVFILGCYKCMPNFWIGLPVSLAGVWLGLTKGPEYFNLIGVSALFVAAVSGWATLIISLYDYWKAMAFMAERPVGLPQRPSAKSSPTNKS